MQYPRYHSNCTPKRASFRLQQALDTHAVHAEAPTGSAFEVFSSEGMGYVRKQSARLPPSPALYLTNSQIRLRHRFFIQLRIFYKHFFAVSRVNIKNAERSFSFKNACASLPHFLFLRIVHFADCNCRTAVIF